jgi:hypothetical protein
LRLPALPIREDIAANEKQVRAKLFHQVKLLFGPSKDLLALRFGHPLKIAKRLQRANSKTEVAAHFGNVARRAVETGEVVLENFYRLEACRRDCLELLIESAPNRNRRDRCCHFRAPACFDSLVLRFAP